MKAVLVILLLSACAGKVKIAPVTVEPIHVTVDVNVREQEPPIKPR